MRRLPWLIFGASVAMSVTGIALLAQVPGEVLDEVGTSVWLSSLFASVMVVFALVGALVASRLPANPIGWLFLGVGALDALYELAYGWAYHALHADPGGLPAAEYAAWVAGWTSTVPPAVLALVLLLFPDGRPPSPRWRPLVWASGLVFAAILVQNGLAPGTLGEVPVENPLGIEGAGFLADVPADPAALVLVLGAIVSLIVRFRRSRGSRRQQLKWLAWSAGLIAAFLLLGSVAEAVAGADGGSTEIVWGFVFAVVLSGIPVSAGIAILRHRLYDIDVVINRTLVYGALTATLAAAYLGGVLVLQLALSPVTQESGPAIAASTLAVAALFRPLRARIQEAVDHRFYRRRYDAARTLEAFSTRLRDEVDLEMVSADLRGVAHRTLQPAHVSLWLRGAP